MRDKKTHFLLVSFLIIAIIYLFFHGLALAKTVLAPIFLAIILAMMLVPVCSFLEKKGVKKGWAAFLSDLIFFLFIVSVLWAVGMEVQKLSKQSSSMQSKLQSQFSQVESFIEKNSGYSIKNPFSQQQSQQEGKQGSQQNNQQSNQQQGNKGGIQQGDQQNNQQQGNNGAVQQQGAQQDNQQQGNNGAVQQQGAQQNNQQQGNNGGVQQQGAQQNTQQANPGSGSSSQDQQGTMQDNQKKGGSETKQQQSGQGGGQQSSIASWLTTALSKIFSSLTTILLITIYIFFMLLYREKFKKAVLKFIPADQQEKGKHILAGIIKDARQYLIGKMILVVLLTIVYSIGFSISGMKSPFTTAFLAGVLSLIPYVGTLLGGVIAVALGYITAESSNTVWINIATYAVAQFVESYFIEPYLIGKRVAVNPLLTIIAVVIGAAVWGVIGMIVFLPLFAFIKVIGDNVDILNPVGYAIGNEDISEGEDGETKIKKKIKGWFS